MENTSSYYDISKFFTFIKEDEKLINFIVNKLKNYDNAKNKFKDDFFDAVKLLLETGEVKEESIAIFKTVDDSYHYNSFYNYFVSSLAEENKFYFKILKLSFLLNSNDSFYAMFSANNKFNKSKINDLLKLNIDLGKQLVLFLDKYTETSPYNKDIWKNYLTEVISMDFDNILGELDEIAKDKKKLSFLIPLLWDYDNDKFYPQLLKFSALTSKQVKDSIMDCLTGYKNGFDDFKKMLKSKKQGERIIGVELLGSLNMPEKVVPLLNELLLKEKAAKVKTAVDIYFSSIKANEAKLRKDLVLAFNIDEFNKEADINKDLNMEIINKIKWLEINTLPKLNLLNEYSEISISLTYSLLNSLSKSKGISLFYEAEKLLSLINKEDLGKFSKSLYEMWKSTDESTEWVLILLSIYYNDNKIIDELLVKLNKSIEDKNLALVKAFTQNVLLIGKKEGFRQIARILNKKYNSTILNIYTELGNKLNIGSALYDLRMNTFGFDENANKTINYGPRSFVLTMTMDFKFTVVADNGKSYKNLPKPSKKDDQDIANKAYEDFKNMKKDLKEYLKNRKSYLENKMINDTTWNLQDWKMIFLENPVMNNFAKGLIWSELAPQPPKGGVLVTKSPLGDLGAKTFRIMDDNTFADIEDEEYLLPKDGSIQLIHPIDLSSDDTEAWKEQLEDYEVIQALDQLNRTVFKATKEQKELSYIDEFKGFMALRISFKSKLMDKYGWNRGPAEDGGCYYSYQKYLPDGMMAQLSFMGECYGGYGDRFQEIWMGELYFYQNNKEIKIKDISKKLLSETYLEIKALADSGSGYNKDYEKTEW